MWVINKKLKNSWVNLALKFKIFILMNKFNQKFNLSHKFTAEIKVIVNNLLSIAIFINYCTL